MRLYVIILIAFAALLAMIAIGLYAAEWVALNMPLPDQLIIDIAVMVFIIGISAIFNFGDDLHED